MSEMNKLINKLIEQKQYFTVQEIHNTSQVIFYDQQKQRIGDAVCHHFSYGHEQGLLEILGLDIEGVEGWLTADEVLQHYYNALKQRRLRYV